MDNQKEYDYSGITKFHKLGLTGKGIKIAVIESPNQIDPKHNESVMDVISSIAPDAKIKLFQYGDSTINKDFDELIEGEYDLINFSMVGADIEKFSNFEVLSQKVFIVASSGNSGKEEYLYPSSTSKCLSVGAIEYGDKDIKYYSTMNDRVDCVNFTGILIFNGASFFNGTSCSAPYTTGMLALYLELYKQKFKRKPMIGETTEYIMENCQDIEEPGKDNKSGYGLFVLNENLREKIWDWKKEKYIDKLEFLEKAKQKNTVQ